jgi:hypothetical protein
MHIDTFYFATPAAWNTAMWAADVNFNVARAKFAAAAEPD